jgi:GNAT superfamily N-acetyltransferase
MQLRIATPDDAVAIAHLHAESWRVAYRGQYSDAYLDGDVFADRRQVWTRRFNPPPNNQHVILAIEGAEPLGFVCAYANDDATWGTLVDNLHVQPGMHRHGLGRVLLAAAAKWSAEHHPQAGLYLWVLEGNSNARAFYEHLGGQPHDLQVSEPPGGGTITGIRYAWQGPTLVALGAHAAAE